MCRFASTFIFCTLVIPSALCAAGPEAQGPVELSLAAEGQQPRGWPVVVELTITNIGKEPLQWFYSLRGAYPPPNEHFLIELRHDAEEDWREVQPTTGQAGGATSTFKRELDPGASLVVPLSLPIGTARESVDVRVTMRKWRVAKAAEEVAIYLTDDQKEFDARRARVVAAVVSRDEPFWEELAEKHADGVVIDAMMKLVTVDNAPIAAAAATVLAGQDSLPEAAGSVLAPLVAQWVPRYGRHEVNVLVYYLLDAAFKTKNESVRRVVLELLHRHVADPKIAEVLVNALRLSPGDAQWLTRVGNALLGITRNPNANPKVAERAKWALEWVESRLNRMKPPDPNEEP